MTPNYQDIDPTLSNYENARRIGVSESTIRRWKKKYLSPQQPFQDIPPSIITSRGTSKKLPDGSWEKITYRPQDLQAIEAQENYLAELNAIIDKHAPTPTPTPTHTHTKNTTAILCINDMQIGKAGEHGGGSKQTAETVLQATHAFIAKFLTPTDHTTPEHVIVIEAGDPIENISNTPTQAYTNDLSLTDQIRTARRLILEVLLLLLPHSPKLTYVCVPSNHGQVRTSPTSKAQAGTVDADFGLEISYQLEDATTLAKLPINYIRPEPLQETATFTTSGTKIAVNHGHRARPGKQAEWWAKQDHGRMPGWDADIFLTAHYHNLSLVQSGNARWLIGLSAPEPGSNYFALSTGQTSKRGCTAFTVHDKVWEDLTVL